MKKRGLAEAPISEALKKFDETPENKKMILAPGLEAVKWSNEKIELDLSNSRPMSPLVPFKIAFEFLALHLGTAIYDEAQQMRQLRKVLCELIEDDSCFKVERLNAAEYKPFHGICFEGNAPHARVLVRLFGWLAFRVHFLGLAVGGPRFIYTQLLDTPNENLRVLES
jgi:hypothetical protein